MVQKPHNRGMSSIYSQHDFQKMTVRDFGVSVTQNVSPLLHVSNVVAIKIGISMQH